jgi:hypothetical protein
MPLRITTRDETIAKGIFNEFQAAYATKVDNAIRAALREFRALATTKAKSNPLFVLLQSPRVMAQLGLVNLREEALFFFNLWLKTFKHTIEWNELDFEVKFHFIRDSFDILIAHPRAKFFSENNAQVDWLDYLLVATNSVSIVGWNVKFTRGKYGRTRYAVMVPSVTKSKRAQLRGENKDLPGWKFTGPLAPANNENIFSKTLESAVPDLEEIMAKHLKAMK